jgi:hypothetical protein
MGADMTKWLQAARQGIDTEAGVAETDQRPVLSVLSVLSEGVSADAATSPRVARPPASPSASEQRTWTGRIVSLAEWRRMTEWERAGPNGRLWCGLCQSWHGPGQCEDGGDG